MSDAEKFVEELKKKGHVPSEAKLITKLTEEDIGKLVVFKATIKEVGIRLSPPINVTWEEIEGEVDNSGFMTKLLDVDVALRNNSLYAKFKEGTKKSDVVAYFNRAMSLFNILGIPFDFVSESDILTVAEGLERRLLFISSMKAERRGTGIEPVPVLASEFGPIGFAMFGVWKAIKESSFFEKNDFYELLGYSRYYYFHSNFLLSFIHGWLFIESMVNSIWAELVAKKFPTPPAGREWSTKIKIDELYLLGHIDDDLRKELHWLRKKRNAIFHADPQEQEVEIGGGDSLAAVKAGLALFYRFIMGFKDDKIIDFLDLAKKMYRAIHEPSKS